MSTEFKHERFEQWRRERHNMPSSKTLALAPWITLDIDETVQLFLAEVPDARPQREALIEYLSARYPHGVHVRSNTAVASESL